jgi:GTP-binding protein
LEKRENLALTFLLIDSRLDPQKIDVEFINWLIQRNIAFLILFTKTDKLSKNQIKHKLDAYQRTLSMTWESVPDIIPVSSVTRTGKVEVLQVIREVLLDIS